MKSLFRALVAMCAVSTASGVSATVISTETLLPSDMNSNFLAATRTGTVNGSLFDISTQTGPELRNDVFFRRPIISSGTADNSSGLVVSLFVDERRFFGDVDKDPWFGISDGTNFLGYTNNDITNTVSGFLFTADLGNSLSDSLTANFREVNNFQDLEQFQLDFAFSDANTTVTVTDIGGARGSYTRELAPNLLSVSSDLEFVVAGNENHETYSFRSLGFEASVASSVPEPTTTALLALGLFGVGAAARRRKVN